MTVSASDMPASCCGKCGAVGCRLYRPGGKFIRPERFRCNACVRVDQMGYYVPLIIDEATGAVWGFTSVPQDQRLAWYALPENDPNGYTWDAGRHSLAIS